MFKLIGWYFYTRKLCKKTPNLKVNVSHFTFLDAVKNQYNPHIYFAAQLYMSPPP